MSEISVTPIDTEVPEEAMDTEENGSAIETENPDKNIDTEELGTAIDNPENIICTKTPEQAIESDIFFNKVKHKIARAYCCVYGCFINKFKHPELLFFKIPTKPENMRQKWLRLIDRADLTGSARVCERHFKPEDIMQKTSRKCLRKNTVPSLVLPVSGKNNKGTQVTLKMKDTATQSQIETKNRPTQTHSTLAVQMARKRELELELECRKHLKSPQSIDNSNEAQQNMFNELSDKFLPRDFALLVKAQVNAEFGHAGKRYTTAYKMSCMHLFHVCRHEYKLLARTMCLPNKTTIYKWHIPISTQINDDLMAIFKLRVDNMSDEERNCTIAVAGINLNPNLYYDIKKDTIFGFHEVDGIQSATPAKHALVVLVRGIFDSWYQFIGYAALSELKITDDVWKWIDTILRTLFCMGLKVKAFINLFPDLLSTAQSKGVSVSEPYFIINGHKIYYIFDASHLIILLRNSLMVYDFHFNNGAVAKFEHIIKFYQHDQTKQFKLANKLTDSHINPTGDKKDLLCYATQLLSKSVASGLSAYIDSNIIDESARHTVELINDTNDLFDVLNSTKDRNKTLPKRTFSGKEEQIELFNKMLRFFNSLKLINPTDGHEQTSNTEFIEAFQITIKSILFLQQDFKIEGHEYLLTSHLNEEIFEYYFEKICDRRETDTPCLGQFVYEYRHLYLSNIMKTLNDGPYTERMVELLSHIIDFDENDDEESEGDSNQTQGSDLQEIQESDYKDWKIRRSTPLIHVCDALLKKCIEKHKECDEFKTFITNQTIATEYDDAGNILTTARAAFNNNILKMEDVFQKSFANEYLSTNVGISIFEKIQDLPFSLPCECFPKEYLQKLFIRMRIHFMLKNKNKVRRTDMRKLTKLSIHLHVRLY